MLWFLQVFVEPEVEVNRLVTRMNPLFIAQDNDIEQNNESKYRNSNNSEESYETKSRNYDDTNTKDIVQQDSKSKSRDINQDSVAESEPRDSTSSREYDVDFGQQVNKLKSRESDNIVSRQCTTETTREVNSRDSSELYDVNSRDVREENDETEPREQRSNEPEPRNTRSNELSNFSITSYQRPRLSEEIYSESTDDEKANFITKPRKLYLHQKFNSTTTLNNTGASLSSDEAAGLAGNVKRSTSHVSLTLQPSSAPMPSKTKSVSNLADEEKKERAAMNEEEQERLLELQEQFLQLQKQLLQNSSLLEKQSSTADAPLQSLQVSYNYKIKSLNKKFISIP